MQRDYELLAGTVHAGGSPVAIPAGGYTFDNVSARLHVGRQRRVSGSLSAFAGHVLQRQDSEPSRSASARTSPSRVSLLPQLSLEPGALAVARHLPDGAFTARSYRLRRDYGFSPLMFASALVQYNSADRAVSSNLRFRWEYAPGSELFVVYTDERDTTPTGLTTPTTVRGIKNRAFVVKVNRLLRF